MSQAEILPALSPPPPRGADVDALLIELLKFGGPAGTLTLLWVALLKEWIVIGSAHRREVGDIAGQRDRALDQVERLLDTNAQQSEALREFARKDDLSVYAVEAIKREALGKGGDPVTHADGGGGS